MSRIQSVDTVRAIAAFAVVVIHTSPFAGATSPEAAEFGLAAVLKQIARFAVPCFFILSGYFWAKGSVSSGAAAASLKTIRRGLLIFAVWCLVYLFPSDLDALRHTSPADWARQAYWNLLGLDLTRTMFSGTRFHLWFLSSLIMCVAIGGLMLARGWTRLFVGLAAVLYVFALLGGAYSTTPLGLPQAFNTRFGPLSGLLFFAMGYLLQRRGAARYSVRDGLVLLAAGTALCLFETWVLHTWFHKDVFPEFLIGTILTGLGAAIIALSGDAALESRGMSSLGLVALGIYAVHVFVIDLLTPLTAAWAGQPWRELAFPLLVFALSAAVALVLSRIPVARNVVM